MDKDKKDQETPKNVPVDGEAVETTVFDHIIIKDETTGKVLVNKRG